MADYTLDYTGAEVDNILGLPAPHIADKNNPHDVTKAQVGLGNVDNTSDADKPLSTAANAALALKATVEALAAEVALRLAGDTALGQRIDNLSLGGRFLAGWDATTGLATNNPDVSPYTYRSGDYFVVAKVGETNYRPDGNSYVIGQASTTVETQTLKVGYFYKYDGSAWGIIPLELKDIVWGNIGGEIADQTDLANALAAVDKVLMATTSTTYAEIASAANAGKAVKLYRDYRWYDLYSIDAAYAYFNASHGTNARTCTLSNENVWSNVFTTTAEENTNKVTSLSASSTDLQYPSAKCVYDELADKADKTTEEPLTYQSGATYTLVANEIATLDATTAQSGDSISIALPASPAVTDCFDIQITIGANVPTINFPQDAKWLGGSAPSFSANSVVEINVMNGLWVAGSF